MKATIKHNVLTTAKLPDGRIVTISVSQERISLSTKAQTRNSRLTLTLDWDFVNEKFNEAETRNAQ